MHGSEYGPDADWEPAPGARLSDCIEIPKQEALDLLYAWQMHEWDQLDDSYKQVVAKPEKLSE